MRTLGKLTVAALAALLLATAVDTAGAGKLRVGRQGIRVIWGALEFEAEEFGITIRCRATIDGRFHTETFAKVPRSLIGSITAANIQQETCVNGIAAFFNGVERYNGAVPATSLPWHLTYEGFTGTLPAIGTIQTLLRGFRIGIRDNIGFCTGQYGTLEDRVTFDVTREAGGGVTTIRPVEGRNTATRFRTDAGICPVRGKLKGTGDVMLLGAFDRIRVTLI